LPPASGEVRTWLSGSGSGALIGGGVRDDVEAAG
jgi:hypothetical protein